MSQYKQKKIGFLDLIWHYKYHLVLYIFVVSFITFAGLYFIGGVPNELKVIDTSAVIANSDAASATSTLQAVSSSVQTGASTNETGGELPDHILISKIGVNAAVSNPNTTDNDILNNYLLKGAVRYPGSGTLGNGNVFIFGHSTGIKIVNNQAFKTFDNLKNLNIGDQIEVDSLDRAYFYSVTSVKLADSDQAIVNLTSTENMLTISTCDVFGEKQQRFVVEASFVKSTPLNP